MKGKPSLGLAVVLGKVKKGDQDENDGEEMGHEYSDDDSEDGGDDNRSLAETAAGELLTAIDAKDQAGIVDAIEAIVRNCK